MAPNDNVVERFLPADMWRGAVAAGLPAVAALIALVWVFYVLEVVVVLLPGLTGED